MNADAPRPSIQSDIRAFYTNAAMSRPSTVADIRAWVQAHGEQTIMQIRNGLSEYTKNDVIYSFNNTGGGKAFMICDVSKEFYANLKEFIRAPDVVVRNNLAAALHCDGVFYTDQPGMRYTPQSVRILISKDVTKYDDEFGDDDVWRQLYYNMVHQTAGIVYMTKGTPISNSATNQH